MVTLLKINDHPLRSFRLLFLRCCQMKLCPLTNARIYCKSPRSSRIAKETQHSNCRCWRLAKKSAKKRFEQQQTPRHTQPPLEVLKSPCFALTDSTTSNTPTEPLQITLSPRPRLAKDVRYLSEVQKVWPESVRELRVFPMVKNTPAWY